jgi:hypothetical protein
MSSCANMFGGICEGSKLPLPKMRGGGFIMGGPVA